jgi:hypothetical protein
MPQAVTPRGKSTSPKVVRVNAADNKAVLYRNLGNGRRLPFIWGDTFTLASGTTEVVVSSGVSFNEHDVSEAIMTVLPLTSSGAALSVYVDKDTDNNVVKLVSTSQPAVDCEFDVLIMLGVGHNFISSDTNQIWSRHDGWLG